MHESNTSRNIFGVCVDDLSYSQASDIIYTAINTSSFLKLAFLNAHCANIAWVNADYRAALADFTVLNDGIGIDIGAKILYGQKFTENLNGTDFVPALIKDSPASLSIGLIGAQKEVAEAALQNFRQLASQHQWRLYSDGFFNEQKKTEILADLEKYRPDILLVAMGVPIQELFIAQEITEKHCKIAIAVGALFDFQAGKVNRAPVWMRKLRIEWVYRLILEPKRLWQRYIIGNPLFLWRILLSRFSAGYKK